MKFVSSQERKRIKSCGSSKKFIGTLIRRASVVDFRVYPAIWNFLFGLRERDLFPNHEIFRFRLDLLPMSHPCASDNVSPSITLCSFGMNGITIQQEDLPHDSLVTKSTVPQPVLLNSQHHSLRKRASQSSARGTPAQRLEDHEPNTFPGGRLRVGAQTATFTFAVPRILQLAVGGSPVLYQLIWFGSFEIIDK